MNLDPDETMAHAFPAINPPATGYKVTTLMNINSSGSDLEVARGIRWTGATPWVGTQLRAAAESPLF